MRPNLVLVPTAGERQVLLAALGDSCRIELCGFGPIAASARTAALVARHAPARVLLAGIAGRFDDRLAIGSAHSFSAVACYGVGAGTGAAFEPAAALGWPQWPGDASGDEAAIGDVIACAGLPAAGLLLTACAASADAADVAWRRRLFPAAVAEDMEGYGVALACRLAGVPLQIVRGISNTAGDRDKGRWQIGPALEAAGELARTLLAPPAQESPR
ncbi:MAG: futalosine hydrolase [Planctomycetota bacterium]